MKKKSPDILWVFAAIFVAGLLFSAVSEGVAVTGQDEQAVIGYVAER